MVYVAACFRIPREPDHIGIVEFSAGETVAAGAALRYTPEGWPAFVAPIYAASMLKDFPVPTGRAQTRHPDRSLD
jgi:hypothetical protein